MYNPFSLEGKTILVTGASSGIGKEIAINLSKLGANLFITGRNVSRLNETYNLLSNSSNNHNLFSADLCIDEEIEKLVSNVDQLDGVCFCAGMIDYVAGRQMTKEKLQRITETNYYSPILLYQKLHLNKKLKKNSSLVFISSVSSYSAVPATLSYAASKSALASAAKVLAIELSKLKIRVNTVSPGLLATNLFKESNISEDDIIRMTSEYPLGIGQPIDVANAVAFLLSDASRWITGSDLIVDGGYLLKK